MNRLAIIVLAIVIAFGGISCTRTDVTEENQQLTDQLLTAKEDIKSLESRIDLLESDKEDLQIEKEQLVDEKTALQGKYDDLQDDYTALQDEYDAFVERAGNKKLNNISYQEMLTALERDSTDLKEYREGVFECEGFALALRDNMAKYGIRCAFVSISFPEQAGHALNAFETKDKGLVYVDVVGKDYIAYVEKGKPYGTICLAGVHPSYIECKGSPQDFYSNLVRKDYDNPFLYNYFELYVQRSQFFKDSLAAYNQEIALYNNSRSTYSEIVLSKWKMNLEALQEDLGGCTSTPGKVVEGVEVYWN